VTRIGTYFKSVMPRDEWGRWVRLPRTPARYKLGTKSPGFGRRRSPRPLQPGASFYPSVPHLSPKGTEFVPTLPAQDVGNGVGQFILHVRNDVAIQIHGDANLGVAQCLTDHLGIDSCLQCHRGKSHGVYRVASGAAFPIQGPSNWNAF